MRNAARLGWSALMMLALVAQGGFGQERPETDPAEAWIPQLGSDDFRLREAASDALGKLGIKALPAMKAALKTTDRPEVSRRLEALLERLEAVRLRDPIRITWKPERRPIKEIIQTVAETAGCKVRFQETPEKLLLSFHWVETPLLQVLDQIGEASGLSVQPLDDDFNRLIVYRNDWTFPMPYYTGPFRFTPHVITMSRQLQIGGLARNAPNRQVNESMNLNLMIASEPKMPFAAIGNAVLLKAVDDRGQSLIEPPPDAAPAGANLVPEAEALMPSYRTHGLNFSVNLGRPHRQAERIKLLKGHIQTCLLVDTQPILSIDNLPEAKGKKFDARHYTVEVGAINATVAPTTIEMTVRRKGGTEEDAGWLQTLYSRLAFHDTDGTRLQFAGTQDARNTPNSTTVLIQLQRSGTRSVRPAKPMRLVFVEWITKQRVVEFELKDIPLP